MVMSPHRSLTPGATFGILLIAGISAAPVASAQEVLEEITVTARKVAESLQDAPLSVVVLMILALGRREALIVGVAVMLTLAATLFASWAWGFTLNRVSLFALIFSIGILVDDAIVVVENIHRHQQLEPDKPLRQIIPAAVDEVGGPTILATFTVIAALLPMAFVSGLMGPYMRPIPINASVGMLLSLAIALVVTPWLSLQLLSRRHEATPPGAPAATAEPSAPRLHRLFERIMRPFLHPARGRRRRLIFFGGVRWGVAVMKPAGPTPRALLGAALPMLAALPLFAPIDANGGDAQMKMIAIMALMIVLLVDDLKATRRGDGAPGWYLGVRAPLTVLIEVAFLAALAAGMRG